MPPDMIDPERRRTTAAAALFVALTLIATYPIARAPASYAFFGHADAQLNMWILAWDARAVARDPRHLFDTNIFAPERRTLAYSETLLGDLPIAGPILWLHGSPALAFNAVCFSRGAGDECDCGDAADGWPAGAFRGDG